MREAACDKSLPLCEARQLRKEFAGNTTEVSGEVVDVDGGVGFHRADVVREWADRHGMPYALELPGPAGGRWEAGGTERITTDALEFCRELSGRGSATGLLATPVPF